MRTDVRDGRRLLLALACALLLAGGLAACGSSGSAYGHSGKGGAACSTTQSTSQAGSTDVNPGSGTSDHGDVGSSSAAQSGSGVAGSTGSVPAQSSPSPSVASTSSTSNPSGSAAASGSADCGSSGNYSTTDDGGTGSGG